MAVTPMFLLFLWLAGAVCRFSVQTGKYIHLIHMIGKCPGYFKHDMKAVTDRINREYGKSGSFKVLLVPGIKTPAIFGLIHPKILMPETDYTEKEIYYILKHEMLHYYQHDMMIKILWETLCSVFWWNPAVFLLKKQITRVLELKVDRLLTAGFSEEEKISYLECIVKSMKAGRQEQTSLMITFAAQKGDAMKQRFNCIWADDCPESQKIELYGKTIMNSFAWKTILRSPVKSLLTFLLIAAASFALFSRVTDYAVIIREAANAESFYHGVAALDNTVPEVFVHWTENDISWGIGYTPDNNPWPTEEQLAEFSSLPGVTLTDTRYMTAGLVEGCKRVVDESYGMYGNDDFVLVGTYAGYENWSENSLYLIFNDITVLAGKCRLSNGDSVKINHLGIEEFLYGESNPYPEEFWKQLEKGSKVLVSGSYWPLEGDFRLNQAASGEKMIRVLDNVGENYLDTEEFAYYKELIEAINQDLEIYDIVYTSDMRSIPHFNERKMVMDKGRPLTAEDTDACVVSELFLETYDLTIGDKIDVRLGDRLFPQYDILFGAKSKGNLKRTSNFIDEEELEIVGTYRFVDTMGARVAESDWSYSQSTIFVPGSLLPVSVPDDYEPSIGQFSVFVEDAR
ncbi:MAG: M56 family metallopeptidase, partial [Lachnospiraceae bacterium]|nr:M56 family metallopeptidase [Lachnospiraceae bacterium]